MDGDFEPVIASNIRRIDVMGVDALGERLVFEIEVGSPDNATGLSLGAFSLSFAELGAFFRQAGDALEEAESRKTPTV